jgi:hypothetical protein
MSFKILSIAFIQLAASWAFATDYYCNGQYKRSGSTQYYPNGQYVNSGSTWYYPNGQYANSGSTRYYPNGQYMNSGSTSYYPNGQYANSGSTRYYPNGQYMNSGSTCYYENGQAMGSCPNSIPVRLSIKDYSMKLKVSLPSTKEPVFNELIEMETISEKFVTNFYVSTVKGSIDGVEASCTGSGDSDRVKTILNLYNSSSTTDKVSVKREICN